MENIFCNAKKRFLYTVIISLIATMILFVRDVSADDEEEVIDESVIVEESEEVNLEPQYMMNGVIIGGVSVGGMTADEAKKIIDDKWNAENVDKNVTLNIDGNSVVATTSELGYSWNYEVVDEALSIGNKGNIIKRYKDVKDTTQVGKNYEVGNNVNDEVMINTINERCAIYNTPHQNAKLTRVGGEFSIEPEQSGRIIDMDNAVTSIHKYMMEEWDKQSDFSITLTLIEDLPTATVADCERVTDLLGSFTTTFSTSSGNYNRNKNMENGVRLLNGITLYKDEVLSVNSYLEPWTEDNGWYAAGTYVNGQVEDSLGGGICQVSSTFYNALLKAEIEIVERYPHSMSVGYVKLSQDAALAGTYKDLKVKNNTGAPIYIEAIYSSGQITFNIYGEETRPSNRTIEYVSETLDTIQPSEVITEDPTKPADYREVISGGHVGYRAKLIKRIYIDGELQSEELVNTSSYAASPVKVMVGTGQAVPEQPSEQPSEQATTSNSSQDDKPSDNNSGDNKPVVPGNTEKPSEVNSDEGGENSSEQTSENSGEDETTTPEENSEENEGVE